LILRLILWPILAAFAAFGSIEFRTCQLIGTDQ
jgi:hypothetical protein